MTDRQVFLSYALEDLETARHLVRAIEARGWAISWERYEDPDAIATLALRESLTASDCVVVLWSAHSVDSPSIREEASSARARGVLVQATLDESAVPMPFVLDEPTPLTDEWSVTTLVQQMARVLDDDASSLSRESEERTPSVETRLEARVLEIAEQYADGGELHKAIAAYERWVEEKSNDMKAVRRLGDLYLASDREQDAATQYRRVAEHYAGAGFLVPAIETYRRIVELTPYDQASSDRLTDLVEQKALQTTGTQRAMSAVQFTLTAPPYVKAGNVFTLSVWAHREDDRGEVANRIGRHVDHASATSSGPALTARVHVDGLDTAGAAASAKSLTWERGIGSGAFDLKSSAEASPGGRNGVVGIYFLGLQIARIHFLVQVGETTSPSEVIPSRQERHTRAVACFAPEDRGGVEARIRAFEKAAPGVEVSMEAIELRARDRGFAEFLDELSAQDVMYLFWSEHAAGSRDVEREWRYALRLRGIDFIDPVPLDATVPPPELATLHDGDWEPLARTSPSVKTELEAASASGESTPPES